MKHELLAAIACGAAIANASQPTAVTITVPWTGASPEQVEKSIVDPFEKPLNKVAGVHEVRATASYGLAEIVVTFEGVPKCASVDAVSKVIREVRGALPSGAAEPVVGYKGGSCKR